MALVFVQLRSVVAAVDDFEEARREPAPGAIAADLDAAQLQMMGGAGRSRRQTIENTWAQQALSRLVERLVDKRGRRMRSWGAALICAGVVMSTASTFV